MVNTNTYPIKTFDDILNMLSEPQTKSRIEQFRFVLMSYLDKKYSTEKTVAKRIELFKADYFLSLLEEIVRNDEKLQQSQMGKHPGNLFAYLHQNYPESTCKKKISRFIRDHFEGGSIRQQEIAKLKGDINRKVSRWFNAEEYTTKTSKVQRIHRDSIIDIAFSLASQNSVAPITALRENGEEIANHLLFTMGYPKLSGSSLVELFYIYALNAGLTYSECCELYAGYQIYIRKKEMKDRAQLQPSQSTTYYCAYIKTLNHRHNKDAFYESIFDISTDLRNGSKWLTEYFVTSFNKQMQKEKLVLQKSCEDNVEVKKLKQLKIRFYLMFTSPSPRKSDEVTDEDLFSSNVIDMDILKIFENRSAKGRRFGSSIRDISDWLCANGRTCKLIRGKAKKEANGQQTAQIQKTNSGVYTLDSLDCAIDKLFPTDDNNTSNNYISREAFIMWLLFCGESKEEIDRLLIKRFDTLNTEVYFDRFAIILSGFSRKNNNIYYYDRQEKKEYLVEKASLPSDLFTSECDLQRTRAGIAARLLSRYNSEHMVNNFSATEDSISLNFLNFRHGNRND